MGLFLGVETSTTNCSVGLFNENSVVDLIEEDNGFSHSEKLGKFTDLILSRNGIHASDLNAIGVGVGPGSYTGLRIGVSFVKGLSFAHGIPIISFTSLELLTNQFSCSNNMWTAKDLLIPMIDARRDEVYCQVFRNEHEPLSSIFSHVLSLDSFKEYFIENDKLFCFGPGANKVNNIVQSKKLSFVDGLVPSVSGMTGSIIKKFNIKSFENTAYFEPFYLKEFTASKPKRSLLSPE